jgi:hypothetical protein
MYQSPAVLKLLLVIDDLRQTLPNFQGYRSSP